MEIKQNNNRIRKVNSSEVGLTSPIPPIRRSVLAKRLLIKGENWKLFEEMRQNTLKDLMPQTEIENILCEKIISALWKLQRAMEIEKNLLNKQNTIKEDEFLDYSFNGDERKRIRNIKKVRISSEEIQQIIQYQFELEKGLQKALERLREEQMLRTKQPKQH